MVALGEVRAKKCGQCGRIFWYAHCPYCTTSFDDWEYV